MNAIMYVHHDHGFWSINYLDDFSGAEIPCRTWQSYFCLKYILKAVGITEALQKACPPSTRIEFLTNIVDSVTMTLEISQERMWQ